MPRSVAKFRHSMRRSSRMTAFHREHPPDRSPLDAPDRPPPPNHRSFLRHTRSFPNLARLVERKPDASRTSQDRQILQPAAQHSLPNDPVLAEVASSHSLSRSSSPTPQPQPGQPLSTSTISTNSSFSATNHPIPTPLSPVPQEMTPIPEDTLQPSPRSKSLLSRVSSSQRLRRLSLSHRSRSRNRTTRCNSFSESPSPWTSSTPSFLSQRSDTDDSLSWSRFFSLSSSDLREQRMWKKRHSSYSCSEFEIAEEENLVEIGMRLPDRADSIAEEDIFGRRRGDFVLQNGESLAESSGDPLLACDTRQARRQADDIAEGLMPKPTVNSRRSSASARMSGNRDGISSREAPGAGNEEERTIENISRAIDSSRGRLRRSANMSKAFRAVIKSGEGFVRKSELVQATLNSEESKDPSVIILLHPESCDPGNSQVEGISRTSEESGSGDGTKNENANAIAEACMGFSTSMTAKQCAATLETILRDISCKVTRYAGDGYGSQRIIRLKATRLPNGARLLDRKIRVMVTIREEDNIRTSVAFRRIAGLYSSRDSHLPLCYEIRDRFQREWPAIVEALYIRLPNVQKE